MAHRLKKGAAVELVARLAAFTHLEDRKAVVVERGTKGTLEGPWPGLGGAWHVVRVERESSTPLFVPVTRSMYRRLDR